MLAREPSIDEVQGFLIGVPMPNTEIRKVLLSAGSPLGQHRAVEQGRLIEEPAPQGAGVPLNDL